MAFVEPTSTPERLLTPPDWPDVAAVPGARAQSAVARAAAVEKVVEAMRSRLASRLLLTEMAELVYLSPFYFNRVFHDETGMPPRRFHMVLRMAAAKRMLLCSDMSVTDICFELGYQSLGTFTTHFRKLVGVSPRGLRRLAQTPAPALARFATGLTASRRAGAGTNGDTHACVRGRVTGAQTADDPIVIVGLFGDACPQGLPAACAVLPQGDGTFALRLPARGTHYLAAAALPRRDDPVECLLPDENSVRVGALPIPRRLGASTAVTADLPLRPMRAIDPPVLLAPPLLLALRSSSAGSSEPESLFSSATRYSARGLRRSAGDT
jgi:AraC-like DNA-binding protein